MRTIKRPRRYISRTLLMLVRPGLRYSTSRDAYVLRMIGGRVGPVLRAERRLVRRRRFDGVERRRTSVA